MSKHVLLNGRRSILTGVQDLSALGRDFRPSLGLFDLFAVC
jgi:hypothetical protein